MTEPGAGAEAMPDRVAGNGSGAGVDSVAYSTIPGQLQKSSRKQEKPVYMVMPSLRGGIDT